MFLRSETYTDYYLAKGESGKLEMYRDGSEEPLKPLRNKKIIKYALSVNGKRIEISLTDFLKSCKEFRRQLLKNI